MRIFAYSTLRRFWTEHPNAEEPLRAWFRIVEASLWVGPADIKQLFNSASFVGSDRVVFNIGGNNFRLVVMVRYPYHAVYILFIGTHAEYDRVEVSEL